MPLVKNENNLITSLVTLFLAVLKQSKEDCTRSLATTVFVIVTDVMSIPVSGQCRVCEGRVSNRVQEDRYENVSNNSFTPNK